MLAVLLINRNRVDPSAAIADAIRDGNSPDTYQAILQVYISTLRRFLRAAGIDTHRLRVPMRAATRDRPRPYVSATLGAALAEWTGSALADLRGLRFANDISVAVEEERLVALQSLFHQHGGLRRRHPAVHGQLGPRGRQ